MSLLNNVFVIYRDRTTNDIKKYSIIYSTKEVVQNKSKEYNESAKELKAEITEDSDLITLITMAEENQKTKNHHVKSIEESIELLAREIYDLQNNVERGVK